MYSFLILSSHQSINPLIYQLKQVKFIYIFHMNESDNKYLEYVERENIFCDKQSLINKLNKDINLFLK